MLLHICRDANVYALASLRVYNSFPKVFGELLHICREANAFTVAPLHIYITFPTLFVAFLRAHSGIPHLPDAACVPSPECTKMISQ